MIKCLTLCIFIFSPIENCMSYEWLCLIQYLMKIYFFILGSFWLKMCIFCGFSLPHSKPNKANKPNKSNPPNQPNQTNQTDSSADSACHSSMARPPSKKAGLQVFRSLTQKTGLYLQPRSQDSQLRRKASSPLDQTASPTYKQTKYEPLLSDKSNFGYFESTCILLPQLYCSAARNST